MENYRKNFRLDPSLSMGYSSTCYCASRRQTKIDIFPGKVNLTSNYFLVVLMCTRLKSIPAPLSSISLELVLICSKWVLWYLWKLNILPRSISSVSKSTELHSELSERGEVIENCYESTVASKHKVFLNEKLRKSSSLIAIMCWETQLVWFAIKLQNFRKIYFWRKFISQQNSE